MLGIACAVAITRSSSESRPRAAVSAVLALPLWPLWAPIALTSSRSRLASAWTNDADSWSHSRSPSRSHDAQSPVSEAASRVETALREGVEACAGTSLESLLPRDAAARIGAEVKRASARHAELTTVLGREGFDAAAAEKRVAALEKACASAQSLATARLHLENVRRLAALRDRDARALEELVESVQALRTQLTLARFAGSSVEGVGGIVSEVWARVEGLGAALGSDDATLDDDA